MNKKQITPLLMFFLLMCFNMPYLSSATGTFVNPIKAAQSADPWVIYKDGFYYLLVTSGPAVWIHKSDKLETLGTAQRTRVWRAADEPTLIDRIWAPELHYLNGRWYVYTCANIAPEGNIKMRTIVLEGDAVDPLKPFKYVSMLAPDQMTIDASVWQDPETDRIYMTWSQWAPDQSIYIGELTTPTTLGSVRVKLSEPTQAWERKGWNVNEGPAFIKRNNKLHIIFSVSGCSTPDYGLARLTCSDGNYLNAASWTKHDELVFSRHEENQVWGVGHHGFAKSPDGSEDWLIYHGKHTQIDQNEDRASRMQVFTWDENDNPVFGEPYPAGLPLPKPYNGTGIKQSITFEQIPNKTVSDSPFSLTAVASSGLPVSFYIQSGPATISNGVIQLTGKPGTVRVYASQTGNSSYCAAWPVFREFKVSGSVNNGTGNGLIGTYFNGKNLNTKILERVDAGINFAWGSGSPATGINNDNFSVQWKGFIEPLYSEVYRFSIISDNGRKLTIDDTVIIDQLRDDSGKEYVGSIYLEAGKKYPLELIYYEATGSANIKLYWWSNSQPKQIIPQDQLYTTLSFDELTPKLKFRFTFDNRLTDESENKYALVPGPNTITTFTDGKYGNALQFNGTSTYFDLAQSGIINPSIQPLTACAWVLNTQTPEEREPLPSGRDEENVLHLIGSRVVLQHVVNDTESNIASWIGGGEIKSSVTNSFTANEWQHIAVVSNPVNKTNTFFVNGTQMGDPVNITNESWTWAYADNGYRIGAHQLGDRSFWHGKIDELCLFEGALTAEQISKVMNNNYDITSVKKVITGEKLRVFPNPAKDVLHVEGLEQIKQLTLMNLDGRILPVNTKTGTLGLAGISSGNYILKVETINGIKTFQKVIVIK